MMGDSPEISFRHHINDAYTRAGIGGFDFDDAISVSAYDNEAEYIANQSYTFNGAIFTSETPIEYATKEQKLSFYAVYPARTENNVEFNFSVATDQSQGDNYEMSDLLTSQSEATNERQPTLSFYHRMSNVVVNIISDKSFEGATLSFNAVAEAECNLADATFVANEDAERSNIKAALNSDIGFKAIITPQTAAANQDFATLTVGNEVYVWNPIENIEFKSGIQYVFNWDIVKNDVELSGIINDWGDIDDDDASDDAPYTRLSHFSADNYPDYDEWIIYDKYANTNDFIGLCNALNIVSTTSNREISIGFVNLVAVPSSAFWGDPISYSSDNLYDTKCLKSVSLPNTTSIGINAFQYNPNIETIISPKLISIQEYAFRDCVALTFINVSNVTFIDVSSFTGCDALGNLDLNSIKQIAPQALQNIINLKTVSIPNVTKISNSAFSGCKSLVEIYGPNVEIIEYNAFSGCAQLVSADFPNVTSIGDNCFHSCYCLNTLALATNSKLSIFGTEVFNEGAHYSKLDLSGVTLTLGSQNESMVNGDIFNAPDGTLDGVSEVYGPFYNIIVLDK